MSEVKGLDEWGYDGSGGSVDIDTHDSGTAQIRVHHDPDRDREYRITFKFKGGDDIIDVKAYDAEHVETSDEAEALILSWRLQWWT